MCWLKIVSDEERKLISLACEVIVMLNGGGVPDCTKEHFEMCGNTFQDVDNNLV